MTKRRRLLLSGIMTFGILLALCFAVSRDGRRTFAVRSEDRYDYLLYLPADRADEPKRPLLLFLHGVGEVGRDATCLKQMHPGYHARKLSGEEFPFVVLCPVTPYRGWNPEQVVDFFDEFLEQHGEKYHIDPERIYLTGLSMGGYSTFHVAATYPDRFAAIVPLAGGGSPGFVESLLTVPIWAFHDKDDPVVSYEQSERVIDMLKNMGHADVQLTTLHGQGHDIAGTVYGNPELYRWLLKHQRPQK